MGVIKKTSLANEVANIDCNTTLTTINNTDMQQCDCF